MLVCSTINNNGTNSHAYKLLLTWLKDNLGRNIKVYTGIFTI